jgi:hypothetical protein
VKKWRTIIAAAAVSASCLATGCAVTGKSATLDSVTKRPFLNIELAPKKRDPAPETQRIRLDGSIPLEPEPAKLVTNGPAKNASWWQRLKGTETKSSISLPRTDLNDPPPEPQRIEVLPLTEPVEF